MTTVGYATLQVIPSMRGTRDQLGKEFGEKFGPVGDQLGKQLGDRTGKAAGKSWTQRFGSAAMDGVKAFGRQMTDAITGAATVGATVAGGIVATGLFAGFSRLQAIDDAEGKLRGLGHTGEEITAIMDSALASVKGTSFGLGDAAGLAATAVAAGIEPGKELTRYLSLIGDTATIAGAPLAEIGSILNKTTTAQKVYTAELNQLADRGLPVFTWLQEEYGVTAEELREMVSAGEVDSARFLDVIEKNIGGAALASGDTFRGGLANVKAALGRAGATFLEPFFEGAKTAFPVLIEMIDGWGEQLSGVMEGLSSSGWGASILGGLDDLPSLLDRLSGAVEPIKGLLAPLAGFLGASGLGGLSSALGPLGALVPTINPLVGLFAGLVVSSKPLQDAFMGLVETLGPLLADLGARFAPILERVQPIIEQVGVVLIGLVEDALGYLLPALNPILDAIPGLLDALSPLIPVIGDLASAVLSVVGPVVTLAAQGLAVLLPYVVDLVAWVAELAAWLLGGITDGIASFAEWLTPILEAIGEGDWSAAKDMLLDGLSSAVDAIGTWVGDLVAKAKEELPKVMAAIGAWIVAEGPGLLAKLGEWTLKLGEWALQLAVAIPGLLGGVLLALGQWIVDVAPTIAEKLLEWAGKFADFALNLWLSIPGWTVETVAAVASWIVAVAPTVFEKLATWATSFRDWVIDTAKKMPGWLWDIGGAVIGFIEELPPKIARAARGMFDGFSAAFKAAVNWIIERWNNLSFTMPSVSTPFGDFGGFTLDTPDIPLLASGGVITEPTLAWVGETSRARPEIVTPEYLMRDVVRDALAEQQPYPSGDIVVQVDGREIARASAPWLRRDRRAAA